MKKLIVVLLISLVLAGPVAADTTVYSGPRTLTGDQTLNGDQTINGWLDVSEGMSIDPVLVPGRVYEILGMGPPAGQLYMKGSDLTAGSEDAEYYFDQQVAGVMTNTFAFLPELTLFNDARVMISLDVEPGLATRPSSNPPGEGTEDNFATHDFNASTDESVFYHFELPHKYVDAGTIHIHYDFFVDTAPTTAKGVVWGVEYKKQSIGDNFDFGAGTTTDYTTIAITTGTTENDKKVHQTSEISLTTTGFAAGDYVLLRMFRDADGTGGTDDFAADARVVDYHIEFLSNKLGEAL